MSVKNQRQKRKRKANFLTCRLVAPSLSVVDILKGKRGKRGDKEGSAEYRVCQGIGESLNSLLSLVETGSNERHSNS